MIELPYAIFRGRYRRRLPISSVLASGRLCIIERMTRNREALKSRLIEDFEERARPEPLHQDSLGAHSFSFRRLEATSRSRALVRLAENAQKSLDNARGLSLEMARKHPALQPLADLVKRLGDFGNSS